MKIILKSSSKNIENFDFFLSEVSLFISNLNYQSLPDSLVSFYALNKDLNIKGIKNFRAMVKSLFYNSTILNERYWISRGWSRTIALENIRQEQSKRNLLSIQKLNLLKSENNYKWKTKFSTNIEYYLEKGYSLTDSEKLRSERQKTFSKEICLNKYGQVKGEEVWKNRQKKWLESISIYPQNEKKDSSSPNFFKNKYGEDWIIKSIDKNFYCNKELIKIAISTSFDIDSFCDNIYLNKSIFSINELSSIFNSTTISEYYNISKEDLKSKLLTKYGLIPTKYGNIRYFNNHICRSNGEYSIAKKLVENNIEYEYEKKYPNSNWISDFYIKKYELYVEYLGFLKNEFMHKYNKKICYEYESRVMTKKQYCHDNKINFIFESDYKTIINKILNYDRN